MRARATARVVLPGCEAFSRTLAYICFSVNNLSRIDRKNHQTIVVLLMNDNRAGFVIKTLTFAVSDYSICPNIRTMLPFCSCQNSCILLARVYTYSIQCVHRVFACFVRKRDEKGGVEWLRRKA
jgi:hypothetical protein